MSFISDTTYHNIELTIKDTLRMPVVNFVAGHVVRYLNLSSVNPTNLAIMSAQVQLIKLISFYFLKTVGIESKELKNFIACGSAMTISYLTTTCLLDLHLTISQIALMCALSAGLTAAAIATCEIDPNNYFLA